MSCTLMYTPPNVDVVNQPSNDASNADIHKKRGTTPCYL